MAKEDWECFSGNDGDLQYWYECKKCGCVIVVDFSDERSLEEDTYKCPGCAELENLLLNKDYPFTYYTKKQIDTDEGIRAYVKIMKEIGFP